MKILVDENMPYARQLFSRLGEVRALPGREITRETLQDADILLVRSITRVDSQLLSDSNVRFVGTATAGTDHVDQQWLAQQGIDFSSAPGCNALAVVEYIFSALLFLAERDEFTLCDKRVGIVGVGNVGGRLQQRLAALGVETLLCDPPRAVQGDAEPFYPLEKLVAEADIITLHTPLFSQGRYRTEQLIDDNVLAALADNRVLINAARGAVVDNAALLNALNRGKKLTTVLDVWQPEPDLSLPLLERVDIGTPHIAGYSLEGKVRGTTQLYHALCQMLGRDDEVMLESLLPPAEFSRIDLQGELQQSQLKQLVHLVYDVRRDDALLRRHAAAPGGFDRLRKQYQERREWASLQVDCMDAQSASLLGKLGFAAVA